MTSNRMEKTQPAGQAVALPGRVGQGTAVEQARAMAEVHAAMLIAREMPRSIQAAISEMTQSCSQYALAQRAAYRFKRAGQTVSGPSVYVARELARCWGNIQYGITELRRDDEFGQSEMQAWAWDVQTNARSSSTFIVPHKRDTKDGAKALTDMRDIYENNANNGARRLREAIFSVLPVWFVEQARQLCAETLEKGVNGETLPQRIAKALKLFEEFGVSRLQLETKLGRPTDSWTAYDVAQLQVSYMSIKRGEITVREEFPEERVTAGEVAVTAAEIAQPQQQNAEPPVAPPVSEQPDAGFDDQQWLGGDQG